MALTRVGLERARAAAAAEDLGKVSALTLRVAQDSGLHVTFRRMIGDFFEHSSTLEYLLASAAWGPSEIRVACSCCGRHLRGALEAPRTSHGACADCAARWRQR